MSAIEMLTVAVAVFFPSDAVRVNDEVAKGSGGVPEITPVLLERTNPEGSAGLTE